MEQFYQRQVSQGDISQSQHYVSHGRSLSQSQTTLEEPTSNSPIEPGKDEGDNDGNHVHSRERRLRRRTTRRE
jgi:hypothetical protein